MNYVENFQNYVLPALIQGFNAIVPFVSQFFQTTFGSCVLIFGCLYLIKIGLKIFRHIQNEAFCRRIGI